MSHVSHVSHIDVAYYVTHMQDAFGLVTNASLVCRCQCMQAETHVSSVDRANSRSKTQELTNAIDE